MALEHFDVIIVGAGAERHRRRLSSPDQLPHQELCDPGRPRGDRRHLGPLSLSRHPLGFRHVHPGLSLQAVAAGQGDRRRTVDPHLRARDRGRNGIDAHIRFRHKVRRAAWSTAEARWTVEAEMGAARQVVRFTCNFLFLCSGYYDYAGGYDPQFPGRADFAGRIVHPQFLAAGPRLQGQECRRDRQRRHPP